MKDNRPTIIIDTREKHPLDFEGDEAFAAIEHTALKQGDYSLKGFEDIVVVERKADVNELYTNMCTVTARARLVAEAVRLRDKVKYRFIVVEQDFDDVMNPKMYHVNQSGRNKFSQYMPCAIIVDNLLDFMLNYNIFVIFAGSKAKSFVKKLLLKVYNQHKNDNKLDTKTDKS